MKLYMNLISSMGVLGALLLLHSNLMTMNNNPAQELRNAIRKTVLTNDASDVDIDHILAKKPGFEPDILFLFQNDKPAAITLMKKFLAYCAECDSPKDWRPVVLNHVKNGLTPLHCAVIAGNCNMVLVLVEAGANLRADVVEKNRGFQYYTRRGSWPLTTAVQCYCSSRKTDQKKLDNYAQIIQVLAKHTTFKGDDWLLNWQTIKGTVGELFYLDGRTELPAVGPTDGVRYLLPDCLKFVESEWPKDEPVIAVPPVQNQTQIQNSTPNTPVQTSTVEKTNLTTSTSHSSNQPSLDSNQIPKKQDNFSLNGVMQNKYFLAGVCTFLLISVVAYKYLQSTHKDDDDIESEDQEAAIKP